MQPGLIDAWRRKVRVLVSTTAWQLGVSAIIIMSFIVTVVELDFAHSCEEGVEAGHDEEACRQILLPFQILDYAFTILVAPSACACAC